ncbi:Carbohydrate kinase domain-containing protein [Papilio xuthus]|uniref:ATP-dependent (S)-NAD(P)H-hydrate dehydratase n=1 Tax=Papilio xuthus TaxID=66420 RepID=A0A194QKQ1_PAPXU|nr:Carbohydrate kinase domain-containing protein [Papilio xuthus]
MGSTMNCLINILFCIIITTNLRVIQTNLVEQCSNINELRLSDLKSISKSIIPELDGKGKGEAGKIGIIGGSVEYTGAPYFAAISALRAGADLVYVITTENAAPIIKAYSPDLIVYPFLNSNSASKLNYILSKMDVIVLGPGLGREDEAIHLAHEIMQTCKSLKKAMVIDADGLFAVYQNISILKDYPSPGVILTPNKREASRLMQAVQAKNLSWYEYWGNNVSVLAKGEYDTFLSSVGAVKWSSNEGGSSRRAGGQGDILSGSLGTFFNWALKTNYFCTKGKIIPFSHSVAAYSAARLTRSCNSRAYKIYGRSMIASDMLKEIHKAFEEQFL